MKKLEGMAAERQAMVSATLSLSLLYNHRKGRGRYILEK